jgi:hypothetical protein
MKSAILIYLFLLLVFINLESCFYYKDDSCAKDYIGTYRLDTTFSNNIARRIVKERQWDTTILISNSDGNYYISTTDPLLKEAEGTWYTKSNNLEGECIGYIKQNNSNHAISGGPFILTIRDTATFHIRFAKVADK